MKYTVELKTSIKISRGKSISAGVVTEMEKKDDAQIDVMREILDDMIRGRTEETIKVDTAKPRYTKMASDKQLSLIRFLLQSAPVTESDLCQKYAVQRLNDLTMADARVAIQELKLPDFERM